MVSVNCAKISFAKEKNVTIKIPKTSRTLHSAADKLKGTTPAVSKSNFNSY